MRAYFFTLPDENLVNGQVSIVQTLPTLLSFSDTWALSSCWIHRESLRRPVLIARLHLLPTDATFLSQEPLQRVHSFGVTFQGVYLGGKDLLLVLNNATPMPAICTIRPPQPPKSLALQLNLNHFLSMKADLEGSIYFSHGWYRRGGVWPLSLSSIVTLMFRSFCKRALAFLCAAWV